MIKPNNQERLSAMIFDARGNGGGLYQSYDYGRSPEPHH